MQKKEKYRRPIENISDVEAAAFPIASEIILHNFMSQRRGAKVKHAECIISDIFQIS